MQAKGDEGLTFAKKIVRAADSLIESTNRIIRERKSTYTQQFEPGAIIGDGIIRQILENANCAPTHKRTEPWRFTVFTGEGLKRLAKVQVELVKKYKPDIAEAKLSKLAEKPLKASHVIAIAMKRHPGIIPEVEEILAVGCAIENMYLTANAYGVGCYFSTGGMTYIEEAKTFLNLSDDDKLIGFFYVGRKKEIPEVHLTRGDINDKVVWADTQSG